MNELEMLVNQLQRGVGSEIDGRFKFVDERARAQAAQLIWNVINHPEFLQRFGYQEDGYERQRWLDAGEKAAVLVMQGDQADRREATSPLILLVVPDVDEGQRRVGPHLARGYRYEYTELYQEERRLVGIKLLQAIDLIDLLDPAETIRLLGELHLTVEPEARSLRMEPFE